MATSKTQHVDFLVLGAGIAGMRAAIGLAGRGRTLVLTKGDLFGGCNRHAQGGIAAALGEDDEVSLHLHDTMRAGDGLCREEAVRVLVEEGPRRIHELIEWGMHFQSNGSRLALAQGGAHSRSRTLHAHSGSTSSEILQALVAHAKSLPNIRVQPHSFAVDLLIEGPRLAGAAYFDEETSTWRTVKAQAVLLATGGLGQVYKETTNPPLACGDGVAMAYRAGALLSDMEFIQFHPTVLQVKGAPHLVLSEELRGEGAQMCNILLERFMPRYHEAAELAPREVVSRATLLEMQRCQSEFCYLDLTTLDPAHVRKRFPKIYSICLDYNIDITADLIPVRPAAHFAMGGVASNLDGLTSLPGLYAAGEVAATGVHGANRLANNSLLEGLVFGARAALAMADGRTSHSPIPSGKIAQSPSGRSGASPDGSPATSAQADFEKVACAVRCLLWEKVGIIRNGRNLHEAVAQLDSLHLPPSGRGRTYWETQNILEVGRLIARSALAREESRGAHYRSDFPLKDLDGHPRHSFLSRNQALFYE